MSLSKTTLSAIQQAGTSLHRATVVVSTAVGEQAEHMVATVSSKPFQAEGEQAIANFKMLARLSQDLQSLEEQLRALYATAAELASPASDVVVALPRPRVAAASANDTAEDAIVKPAPLRRTKAKAKAHAQTQAKKPAKAVALTSNDNKVLDYLKTVLKAGEWTALTGASVSQGANMPLGSVGISLKKVVESGAVKKKGRGSYQLVA